MSTVRYTKEHEWIKVDGDTATIGITDHAQQQLGDVVFVELPAVGKRLAKGGDAAVVESVKAASEVYAPVSGDVIEVNASIVAAPSMINQDPENSAWFMKIRLADKSELDGLFDEASYKAFVAEST
ncbi:MAG TPA: glycine cleavage system protein GcvH [Aestuariivirgaceae bacterium]|nr:glycine cleavage system protein GcvH [Aestuariivirgaceae bacterium]